MSFVSQFFHRFREKVPGERVWALMGVGCYIWREDEPPISFPSYRLVSLPGREAQLHLECLEKPFPRYRLVYESIVFDDETAIRALRDGEFDPLQVVILDRAWTFPVSVGMPFSPTIQLLSREPEAISFRVQTPQTGFLVVGDPWYPGWRARVDGQPVPVLRAYTALRAVPLTPGDHIVQLCYQPVSFYLGLALSGLSLSGLVVWVLSPSGPHHRRHK
ncbi:MAG: YfhO family protein [Anaerolineae bacterium]